MTSIARHLGQDGLAAPLLSAIPGDTPALAPTDGVQRGDLGDPTPPARLGDYTAQARKTIRIDGLDLAGRRVARSERAGDLGHAFSTNKLVPIR